MAKYRATACEIWEDDWYLSLVHACNDKRALFFHYLFTNMQTHSSGLYPFFALYAKAVLALSDTQLGDYQQEFQEADKAFWSDGWVFVVNFLKHQPSPNPRVWASISAQLRKTPVSLLTLWWERYCDRLPREYHKGIERMLNRDRLTDRKRDSTETDKQRQSTSVPPSDSTDAPACKGNSLPLLVSSFIKELPPETQTLLLQAIDRRRNQMQGQVLAKAAAMWERNIERGHKSQHPIAYFQSLCDEAMRSIGTTLMRRG